VFEIIIVGVGGGTDPFFLKLKFTIFGICRRDVCTSFLGVLRKDAIPYKNSLAFWERVRVRE